MDQLSRWRRKLIPLTFVLLILQLLITLAKATKQFIPLGGVITNILTSIVQKHAHNDGKFKVRKNTFSSFWSRSLLFVCFLVPNRRKLWVVANLEMFLQILNPHAGIDCCSRQQEARFSLYTEDKQGSHAKQDVLGLGLWSLLWFTSSLLLHLLLLYRASRSCLASHYSSPKAEQDVPGSSMVSQIERYVIMQAWTVSLLTVWESCQCISFSVNCTRSFCIYFDVNLTYSYSSL